MYRQLEDGEQARFVVCKRQLSLVKVSDRFRQGEAKARAFIGPAGVEPAEAPASLVTPVGGDARPAIADLHTDLSTARLHVHLYRSARRTVADGVLDQVADRLRQELPMAEQRDWPARPIEFEARSSLLGQRVVHFGKFGR